MTDLAKSPVTRRTTLTFKGRRVLVTLREDDVIVLRLERLSESIKIPIADLLRREYGAAGADVSIPARKKR